MSAGWVAPEVRGRALLHRRLGRDRARALAALGTLELALTALASSAYGREVHRDMGLATAEDAISKVLVWHLRILAGWCRPIGASCVRLLAGGFEVANITGHLVLLAGQSGGPPLQLGSLETAWTRVSKARSPGEVRATLAASEWGDPESEDPFVVRTALDLAWARRVASGVPDATAWATSYALLAVGRLVVAGATTAMGEGALRDARRLLGPHWERASSVGELAALAPRAASLLLSGIEEPDELWRAEARFWAQVEADAAALLRRGGALPGSVVAVVGLLGADAWRTRAALELAARGGGDLDAVLDAVA